MSRPKKTAPVQAKKPREGSDPRIEEIYEREITFTCPVRGLVKQKVKVKRYRPLDQQVHGQAAPTTDKLTDQLDKNDDGMSIYEDGDELGVVDKEEGDS